MKVTPLPRTLTIIGRRSTWSPCPITQQVLQNLLREIAPSERHHLPINATLAPLLSPAMRESLGLHGSLALDSDNTAQPDPHYGEATLLTVVNVVLAIQRKLDCPIHVEIERGGDVGWGDRSFLRLLEERAEDHVQIRWVVAWQQKVRKVSGARILLTALQNGNRQRALTLVLQGTDRALVCGLHREAARRLRLAVHLFRATGDVPHELVERLGLAWAALGRHEQAYTCQRWLVAHAPTYAERCMALTSQAVQLLLQGITPETVSQSRRLFADATLCLKRVQDEEKRPLLHAMLLNSLSLPLYRRGKLQAALAKCTRAYQVLEEHGVLQKHLGQVGVICNNAARLALLRKDADEAGTWVDRLADIAGDHPQVLENVSKLYSRINRWEDAAKWAGIALQTGASLPRLYVHRALCWFHLGLVKPALADLTEVERLMPADEKVYLLRASVLELADDLSGAVHNYQAALHLNPKLATAWADLARVYWISGEKDSAHAALRTAAELAPERQDLQALLAEFFPTDTRASSGGGT